MADKSSNTNARRALPDDPLAFIRECVRERRVIWTYHVNVRMKGRYISRQMILDFVDTYEIIEAYPDDKYLPSYLACARRGTDLFHVLFGLDVRNSHVRVITSYRPDPGEWDDTLTKRLRP